MIKNLLLAASLVLGLSGAAFADKSAPLVFATGVAGGKYDAAVTDYITRMGQRGYSNITKTNNNGSDAITLQACSGKADLWIAQVDALFARFNEGCSLTPVANFRTEVAVILFPPDSEYDELSDLSEKDVVATDGIGSGTELWFKTAQGIEQGDDGSKDSWSLAQSTESSVDQLNTMASFGDIQAAVLVRTQDSPDIQLLLDQGWTLGYLWDKDIDDQEFNNKPLYEAKKVTIEYSQGAKSTTNWVYDVRSFIGTTKAHAQDRELRTDLAKAAQ